MLYSGVLPVAVSEFLLCLQFILMPRIENCCLSCYYACYAQQQQQQQGEQQQLQWSTVATNQQSLAPHFVAWLNVNA